MRPFQKISASRLLISIITIGIVSSDSCMHGKHMTQDASTPPPEVNTSLPVLMGTKAVLCCHPVPLTSVLVTTWKITLRHRPTCTMSYKKDTNETTAFSCADERITWASRPDQDPKLQIDPVALSHDGNYSCEMITHDGNFCHRYHLQVLVPPEVILYVHKNRTAECKAVAGKPAANVSWFPPGDCLTGQDSWANGTVTVWSTCNWPDSNVTKVTCSVSHSTGEKSLSKELPPGFRTLGCSVSSLLIILYVKFSLFLVVLFLVGFIFFKTTGDYRNVLERDRRDILDLLQSNTNLCHWRH
ncbi:cell surface glycoprotein CD200 receptor 2-like [Ochotona princeps]|uniref:cell surface glycoprotein CD200 receptor 2-like n=1 Tax=Ochotona princeps TaxID=9978 RepID=UPI002714FA75|nr:cell surface glycoprotein CD200 receptor 2-like [Ochotona princeps]